MSNWINVEDELPETYSDGVISRSKEVIVYINKNGENRVSTSWIIKMPNEREFSWLFKDGVTHWMSETSIERPNE